MRFPPGCLPLALFLFLVVLLPFFLADIMLTALGKLGLSPQQSLLVGLGIFLGGMVNIPIKKLERQQPVDFSRADMFGLRRFFNPQMKQRSYTLIAVNLGGCLIPGGLAVYQIVRIIPEGSYGISVMLAAIALNIVVCYQQAQPVQNVGIAMRPLFPALTAVACGLLFLPEQAPAVAFAAGVLGPLVGADLLHLNDIQRISTGTASIGGAGTFDGIVISGILATLLA